MLNILKKTGGVISCIAILGAAAPQAAAAADATKSPTQASAPLTQSKTSDEIIGVVTDSHTGEPLVGATVRVVGTQIGMSTDINGKFHVKASKGQELEISYIGYTTKKVKIGDVTVLTITLSDDANVLQETVVTAFGTSQKKETVTGAIQTVRPSDLKVPATNLSTAFAGRLSGVVAYQRSGEPGSNGASFYIRGVATMSGAVDPLIVMDGVEISSADLNAIDPEIIESFSVLKDATATAMYGTRGANGVLIIKTKSGADLDRPVIGLRVENWINTPIKTPKIVDGVQFMKLYNEAVSNEGTGDLLYTDDKINGTINGLNQYTYPNVNWYDELFKEVTWNQRANFNVRGGTSKITYFMNVNVSHETSMLKDLASNYFSYSNNTNYMKYAFQNNVDFNLSKDSKLALHLNVQLNNKHSPVSSSSDLFSLAMQTNPVDFPISYPQEDDDWIHWGSYIAGTTVPNNPVAESAKGYTDYFESTVVANLNFDQKLDFITKGLSFHALVSFKNWSYNSKTRSQSYNKYVLTDYSKNADGTYDMTIEPSSGTPSKQTLEASFSTSGDRRYYIQSYFNYDRKFGDHNVSGMALFNMDQYDSNVNSSFLSSLPKRRMGFAARLSYDYMYRYLVEINAGYNGSESFAKGHRWGFFPSASIGWNVSEEPFWEPIKNVVNQLKLRASYGLVGNDEVGSERFAYQAIVNLASSDAYQTGYGSQTQSYSGPTFTRYENNELTWEVGHKLNLGLDLQLFDALHITVDYFNEIRDNIFQSRSSIPNYFGTASTSIYGNLAKVKNWGVDASIDYGKQVTKDFAIQFRGSFTFARNKVLEYDEGVNQRDALKQVGRSLYTYFGYVADGLYIDEADIANSPTSTLGNIAIAPGDIKYVDQPDENGEYDGLITADDRVQIGHPYVPEIVYGFGPSMSYKKWDLSFYFQGQANVSLMMSGFAPFGSQNKYNVLQWIADDHWSMDNQNPNAQHPRLTKSSNDNNMQTSTYWLRDASFLRLKNFEVGYSFKLARVYFSAVNLCTFSKFKLWDPEQGGGAGMSYPLQRTFNIGVQLTFK